jgi:hypothetical protein
MSLPATQERNNRLGTFFRAVLTPPQESWPEYFRLSADAKGIAEGYCMSPEMSVPHVTLGKFEVADEAGMEKIWQEIRNLKPPKLVFDALEIRAGKGDGYNWPMLMNRREGLMEYQRDVMRIVRENGGTPDPDAGAFDPHLTLFRAAGDHELLTSVIGDLSPFMNQPLDFDIAVGAVGDMGKVPVIVRTNAKTPAVPTAPVSTPKPG